MDYEAHFYTGIKNDNEKHFYNVLVVETGYDNMSAAMALLQWEGLKRGSKGKQYQSDDLLIEVDPATALTEAYDCVERYIVKGFLFKHPLVLKGDSKESLDDIVRKDIDETGQRKLPQAWTDYLNMAIPDDGFTMTIRGDLLPTEQDYEEQLLNDRLYQNQRLK